MIEFPGRIPVVIHPFFWVFAGLIGWLNSGTLVGMLIWIGIIFFSVLFHEFGHALTALCFKQKTNIQLIALGGVTSFDGPKLKFWQQFFITLNGPLFGFALFLLATGILQLDWSNWPVFSTILKWTQLANLFWTIVNLLPVMPLDGGQLLRILLEAIFGINGYKAALLIGAVISVFISLYFFLVGGFLIGAFFFLFAFQSFESWRKSRHANRSDRDDEIRKSMIEAETALQEGDLNAARRFLEEVRNKAEGGLLAQTAAQYLAFIDIKEGKRKEAYDLLLPIKKYLADDSLAILHQLAAEQKNYPLVAELSSACYQILPSQQMALNNARAFASLNQPKHAGGWLQTAWQEGSFDLLTLLNEEVFQSVKDHPDFKQFIDPLKNKDN